MFFIFALVVVVVAAVGYIGWKYYEDSEKNVPVGIIVDNTHTNTPVEKKGTVVIKCGNKKEIKPLLTPDRENCQVRRRKVNNPKKESDDVKKVEVGEEKKKKQPQKKNKNDNNKKKEYQEIGEKMKLRENQRKSAPVCPSKKFCDEENCENECNILCSKCNTYLCTDCYKNMNMKPDMHCIKTKTVQTIIKPIICETDDNNTTHPLDCYLRTCKHVFHKSCLLKNYEIFKKCHTCIFEGIATEEFKLTDILTDFFDPIKNAEWKIYPVVYYEPKKKPTIAEE